MSLFTIYMVGTIATCAVSIAAWIFSPLHSKSEWFSVVSMITCWAWPVTITAIVPAFFFLVYRGLRYCALAFRTYTLEVWQ